MAEGNNTECPHDPRAIRVHHLVMDAVTKGQQKKQGATVLAIEQDHPQGSAKTRLPDS